MHRSLFPLASLLALIVVAPGCADRNLNGPEQLDPRVLYGFESCDELLGYAKSNAKEMIEEYGNPWGYEDDGIIVEDGEPAGTAGESGGDPVGDSGGDGGQAPGDGENGGADDFSGTNVQEVGVDEPDLVKTDGERILALAQGKLHFVDASGVTPQLRGSLELGDGGWDAQLFMHEDRALLLMRSYLYDYGGGEPGVPDGEFPQPLPAPGLDLSKHFPKNTGSIARLVEIDISDPDNLRIVSNLYVNGDLVSARLIDGVARVVLRSSATGLEFKGPYDFMNWDAVNQGGGGEDPGTAVTTASPSDGGDVPPPVPGTSGSSGANQPKEGDAPAFREGEPQDPWTIEWNKAKEQAKLYNLAIVESSTVEDWLPHYVLEDLSGGESKLSKGLLLDCTDVRHPGSYSGLSTLSVLTVDLDAALALGKGVGVFSEGETIYASKQNLYVTTSPWRPQQWTEEDIGAGLQSYVHKFSLASAEQAEYVASGEVRGRVRSQWSLSEHEGDLRIATTDQQSWDSATTESFVSVLRQTGDELGVIGQVGGLGKGEEIQGVRFIGGVGYVVTFRQTDPLYTIDLHDPTKPVVAGELKIPGFSAYLHPVGEDLILGVGFAGTDQGDITGLQLSLFDVSDLKAPKRIHQAPLGEAFGWSEATFDPKAFLYWGKTKLAVLPVESYTWDEVAMTESQFAGAIGYTIDAQTGITPIGQVEHAVAPQNPDEQTWLPSIRRSMVIGDRVLTLSELGLKASLIGDLSDVAFVEF
ncbi:beta-propeller domain-containing protein [Nannocystis sp.]|uniref:beta-propeller domain-containing protein n=1 Tax=Nannocystis sp. TaxID=1962667 RepID=UPI0025F6DFF0|nr:beta-propeller domain-containing protein [Nannocystis sp.]MBK7826210.1 beta-propeller domain-containing protein [Nannocystis sp.]